MDELSLRTLFHGALDEVAPPKPWLATSVREQLDRRRVALRSERRFRFLSPAVQRAVAAVLVVLIAAGAAAAAIAIYEYRHHVVPIIPTPIGPVTRACGDDSGGVRMFDKNVGWRGTERTTDGGRTWRDVSPPNPPPGLVKGGGATCTLNPDAAWVVYGSGSVPYQPTKLVLMSTVNAGQSWQQDGVIPIPWSLSWRITFSVLLDFYDLQHGWLFMEDATKPLQRRVYATGDGGKDWSLVSAKPDLGLGNLAFDCSQTGLMFDTPKRGWLTWGCSSGFGDTPPAGAQVVATTNDGGRTWAPLRLVGMPSRSDATCDATSPIFTRSDGVLQTTCSGIGQAGTSAVYSTTNGGKTWSFHPFSHFTTIDFVDGTTGYYFAQADPNGPNALYRTNDGGGHWTVVVNGLFPGKSVSGLTFIDGTVGFVGISDSPAPWWTYDGGKTWALPSPYRSAGNTVCDLFKDPAAEYQLPQSVKMVSPTVGWAPGTRRTTDGGIHWTRVAPPEPKYRAIGYDEFFLDADHAWVVDAVGTQTACADRFLVYQTSDGGASWQQISSTIVTGLDAAEKLAGTWTLHVEFLDTQHGWLAIQPRYGYSGRQPGPVFATDDGGKHWTLFAATSTASSGDCSGSGLPVFSSPTTGWVSDVCTGGTRFSWNVLVTRDGGQTWSNVELVKNYCDHTAYPTGCLIAGPVPRFFDPSNGWLFDSGPPALLVTSDGGQSWTRRGLPHGSTYTCQGKYGPTTCSTLYIDDGSFISPTEGWVAASITSTSGYPVGLVVEHTTDGGKTWTVVMRRHISIYSDQGEFFQFVDSTHGFWWFGNTVTATSDGGRTWTSARVNYR